MCVCVCVLTTLLTRRFIYELLQPDWPGSVSYCITAMPEYAHLSFEELRYAHYKPGEQGTHTMPRF